MSAPTAVLSKVCAVVSLVLSYLSAPYAHAAACDASGPRASHSYPVVMRGLTAAAGHPVRFFAAYARKFGAWHPVPIQIDEVNSNGDFVLDGGIPYTRGTDDGLLDANDEVVVSGAGLGDAFTAADVDLQVRAHAVKLWHVRYCRGSRWLGDLLIAGTTAPSSVGRANPAATFSPEAGQISTGLYGYRFDKQRPALLGEVFLKTKSGDAPVLSNAQFMMPLKTPFFVPDLTIASSDFESRIESWQVGPLRSIVAVGVKYSAFLSLLKLHLFSELVFYENRFTIPTVIEFAFDPTKLLNAGSGIAYSLSFPKGRKWEIDSNLPRLPRAGLEPELEAKRTADRFKFFEAKGASDAGSFRVQVAVAATARKTALPPYLLLASDFHDESLRSSYPWLADLSGDLGLFVDFSQVPQGAYDFGLDLLLSARADETFADYGSVDFHWHDLPPLQSPPPTSKQP